VNERFNIVRVFEYMRNVMYKLVVSLLLCFATFYSNAQTGLFGRSYSMIISETCKERTNGGCWIVESRILKFEEDSLLVYNQIRGNCSPADSTYDKDFANLERYAWIETAESVIIRDCSEYGTLFISGDKLIGKEENEMIEFVLIK